MSIIFIEGLDCAKNESLTKLICEFIMNLNSELENRKLNVLELIKFYVEIKDKNGNLIKGTYKSNCRPVVDEIITIEENVNYVSGKLNRIL